MAADLQRAREQAFALVETLSAISEKGVCDDLIKCQDGLHGNIPQLPTVYLNGFRVPEEASPLTMAARLESWIVSLQERLNEQQGALN